MPQHMWKRIEGTGFFVVVKGKKSKYEITYSVFPTFLAKIALALAQKQKYVLGGFCRFHRELPTLRYSGRHTGS